MKAKIIIGVLIILAILAIIAAVAGWRRELPVVSKTQYVKVPEIQTVTKIRTVRVPVKDVVTLEKKTAAQKLKLSEEISGNDDKQIVATAEIPPYEGKTDTVTVLDTATGKSEIIAKQQQLPFFALENKREIGLRWGLGSAAKSNNNTEADIYGRWDFLRLGNVHIGAYGEVASTGDGRAMISIGYRW